MGANPDVVGLDELSDLHESIPDALFLAHLADGLYGVVTDLFVIVDQMGDDLFELKAVVFALLLHQQLLVELGRKSVSKEVPLHVSLVIFGPGSDDGGEFDIESLVGQGNKVLILVFAVQEEVLGYRAARANSPHVLLVLQSGQEMLAHLFLSVLIQQVDVEYRRDIFSRGDSLNCAELKFVLFVAEHLLGLILALG